jgi:hypothetical protein
MVDALIRLTDERKAVEFLAELLKRPVGTEVNDGSVESRDGPHHGAHSLLHLHPFIAARYTSVQTVTAGQGRRDSTGESSSFLGRYII